MLQFTEPGSASACAFVMLVTANAVLILATRSAHTNLHNLCSNFTSISLWVLAMTLVALVLVTTHATLLCAFKFSPITISQWMTSFGFGLSLLTAFLVVQWLSNKLAVRQKETY